MMESVIDINKLIIDYSNFQRAVQAAAASAGSASIVGNDTGKNHNLHHPHHHNNNNNNPLLSSLPDTGSLDLSLNMLQQRALSAMEKSVKTSAVGSCSSSPASLSAADSLHPFHSASSPSTSSTTAAAAAAAAAAAVAAAVSSPHAGLIEHVLQRYQAQATMTLNGPDYWYSMHSATSSSSSVSSSIQHAPAFSTASLSAPIEHHSASAAASSHHRTIPSSSSSSSIAAITAAVAAVAAASANGNNPNASSPTSSPPSPARPTSSPSAISVPQHHPHHQHPQSQSQHHPTNSATPPFVAGTTPEPHHLKSTTTTTATSSSSSSSGSKNPSRSITPAATSQAPESLDLRLKSFNSKSQQVSASSTSTVSHQLNNNLHQTVPPFPIQRPPLLTPADQEPNNERAITVLEGQRIACFTVGGEKRLCVPQIISIVLGTCDMTEIHAAMTELQIYCSTCTPEQIETFKRYEDIPVHTPSCGLMTKSDAHRLCSSLLPPISSQVMSKRKTSFSSNFSVQVYHECFGRCVGLYAPALYLSEMTPCIQCDECKDEFTPTEFVCHSHSKPGRTENRTIHWGFDPNNWRHYLLPVEDCSYLDDCDLPLATQQSITNNNKQNISAYQLPVCSGGRKTLQQYLDSLAAAPSYLANPALLEQLKDAYHSEDIAKAREIIDDMKERFKNHRSSAVGIKRKILEDLKESTDEKRIKGVYAAHSACLTSSPAVAAVPSTGSTSTASPLGNHLLASLLSGKNGAGTDSVSQQSMLTSALLANPLYSQFFFQHQQQQQQQQNSTLISAAKTLSSDLGESASKSGRQSTNIIRNIISVVDQENATNSEVSSRTTVETKGHSATITAKTTTDSPLTGTSATTTGSVKGQPSHVTDCRAALHSRFGRLSSALPENKLTDFCAQLGAIVQLADKEIPSTDGRDRLFSHLFNIVDLFVGADHSSSTPHENVVNDASTDLPAVAGAGRPLSASSRRLSLESDKEELIVDVVNSEDEPKQQQHQQHQQQLQLEVNSASHSPASVIKRASPLLSHNSESNSVHSDQHNSNSSSPSSNSCSPSPIQNSHEKFIHAFSSAFLSSKSSSPCLTNANPLLSMVGSRRVIENSDAS